ncbi:MAG: hypothetical protein A2V62_09720 [Nitrospirae bacterium RBG_19FT_COMBO_58_9]|nr:MAG: hypothetical protein A2V62_09720 [Nitrospirae bacterium RBG_19FT_COMBO_58_9]
MDGLRMTQNGAPQNPSAEVERRILNTVQETRLFSTLLPLGENVASLGEKAVTARITFDETVEPHSGAAAWKGFVIGASMFLLSPVIELHYDYAAKATLELERWDGQVKRYEAQSSGTAHYNLFGATPIMIGELKGEVTEACLTELMDQLVRDTTFYMASNTPLPDSSKLTVTVKARKPSGPSASSSVIPVATVPAP